MPDHQWGLGACASFVASPWHSPPGPSMASLGMAPPSPPPTPKPDTYWRRWVSLKRRRQPQDHDPPSLSLHLTVNDWQWHVVQFGGHGYTAHSRVDPATGGY